MKYYDTKLEAIQSESPPAFALLHRPVSSDPDSIDLLIGTSSIIDRIDDIPLQNNVLNADSMDINHDVVTIIPFRQIIERNFSVQDDSLPIIILSVSEQNSIPMSEVINIIQDVPIVFRNSRCDIGDGEYENIVRHILHDEIGSGQGSNFVIKRSFFGDITGFSVLTALAIFRRLLERERGAYWIFLVHTGDRTFIGASPERHATLIDGVITMNPISGTFRYPKSGSSLSSILQFLSNRKEDDELCMVLDEELKMMGNMCDHGGYVTGPYLKEMARVAHTEYLIQGRSSLDVRQILRETMFSPAVTGSPLENAFRVISKYEYCGRGYYSGIIALISMDSANKHVLDSSIVIRTADIDSNGLTKISVGSTIVRHSDPTSEAAETTAKASTLFDVLEQPCSSISREMVVDSKYSIFSTQDSMLRDHPKVRSALEERNKVLSSFWFTEPNNRNFENQYLVGCRALVVDAEDSFTAMLGHQLRSLGLLITIRGFDQELSLKKFDFVVVGPGPGDPRDLDDKKISKLRSILQFLINERIPFLAVCLSHQVLCSMLGLELVCKRTPNQGIQKKIYLFGKWCNVGFYNTFIATCNEYQYAVLTDSNVELALDYNDREVHALRGEKFVSIQFHPESILTENGIFILQRLILPLNL